MFYRRWVGGGGGGEYSTNLKGPVNLEKEVKYVENFGQGFLKR